MHIVHNVRQAGLLFRSAPSRCGNRPGTLGKMTFSHFVWPEISEKRRHRFSEAHRPPQVLLDLDGSRSKTDFNMTRFTALVVGVFSLFSLTPGVLGAGVGSVPDELLDLVPSGYVFLADAPAGTNPPETQWLTNGKPDVLAGVMWEEHRPVRRVEIEFAGQVPEVSQLSLEVTTSTPTEKQDNRPTWWTRAFEAFPGSCVRSADGHRLVYETSRDAIVRRLSQYPEGFRYEADPQGLLFVDKVRVRYLGTNELPRIVSLRAFGAGGLAPIKVEVEWGFQSEPRVARLDGRVEIYNGRLAPLKPLPGSRGCVISGPDTWRSDAVEGTPRGIELEMLYVRDDAQEVRFRPSIDLPVGSDGRLTYHPNRTVVTLRTTAGNFSFSPKDLEGDEPILIPSLGFLIYRAGGRASAMDYVRRLSATKPGTIRQRVRSWPEQSLARALADQYGTNRPALSSTSVRAADDHRGPGRTGRRGVASGILARAAALPQRGRDTPVLHLAVQSPARTGIVEAVLRSRPIGGAHHDAVGF